LTWLLNGSVPPLRDSPVRYFGLAGLPIALTLKKRILETLATPGRPGVRKIAARFGVNFETVQRISRPFDRVGVVVA
jgi:hypothetical protein